MDEILAKEVLNFIQKCDEDIAHNVFSQGNYEQAKKYLEILNKIKKENDTIIINAYIKKLDFIIKQIDTVNYHTYKESIVNLVSLSATDYIINLIQAKRLTNPVLIARYAYIELAKVLYYDVSYVIQTDPNIKKRIGNAPINIHKEKIFSYVVCTQWLQLYTYILKQFGINVIKRSKTNQGHVWGEIALDNDHIIIADATDYINSSIDLSNAKAINPTVGFVVLPKEYSHLKLYDTFYDRNNWEIAEKIKGYYALNRDLDMSLGYITKKGYASERIIAENELFQYSDIIISEEKDFERFLEATMEFFKKVKIPNNIDGYEIFAYYNTFIKKLPRNIMANISQKTLYVDSFAYKQKRLRKTFLHAPNEYLKYLNGLVYSRYYKYLSEEEHNSLLEQMKSGSLNGEQVSNLIAKYEMVIAEINRNINLHYAINKLQFYYPYTGDTLGIQLYEPMMGTKNFNNLDDFYDFKERNLIK